MPLSARPRSATVAALLAAVLFAAGLTVAGARPAAAEYDEYVGSRSPMTLLGTDYADPEPGHTNPGSWYWGFDEGNLESVFVDSNTQDIHGFSGDSDIDVALATLDFGAQGTRMMTVYVDSEAFSNAGGGPYARDCTGFDSLASDVTAAWVQASTCVAFRSSVLQAHGHGNDFTFTPNPASFDGFTDASGAPLADGSVWVTNGYVDPTEVVYDAPPIVYQGTASPFEYDGTTFDADIPPETGSGGAAWWAPHDGPPFYINGAPTGIPLWPNPPDAPYRPVHAILGSAGGADLTIYVDSVVFGMLDPQNPFPADCPGFEALMDNVTGPGFVTCTAFRADMWAPPDVLGEQYTCASDWQTGWTGSDGSPIAGDQPKLVDGAPNPALTPVGVNDGPGVCLSPAPPPPDPPTPPGPDPTGPGGGSGGSGTGGSGTGSGAPGGSVPTLPATGIDLSAVLALAVLVAGTGLGLTALSRRRRVTS